MLIVVSVLLVGLCYAHDEVVAGVQMPEAIQAVSSVAHHIDPVTIDPCYPKPVIERPIYTSFSGELIDHVWLDYIKQIPKLPNKFKSAQANQTCRSPWSPQKDMRRYYWQISCPYSVFWLSKFTRPHYAHEETCYVIAPCWQQVRVVNCTSKYCWNRCRTAHPQVRNSICLENNFRTYRVWVFCTHTHIKTRGKTSVVDCKLNPSKCLRRITLRVPQCCECWSCWDMYVTMPPTKPLPIKGKK